jgi:putative DNA primase/helicase
MKFRSDQYETFWLHELDKVTRSGHQLRAACPVHGGDSPNTLSVDLNTGFAHCFKCHNDGQGWDMIGFAMARYGFNRQSAWDYVRGVVGDISKPSVAPWRFPFPKPLAITDDDWRLGCLARRIEQYGEYLDQQPEPGPGWMAYAAYVYEPAESLKVRYRHKVTGEKRMIWLALTSKGGWSKPSKLGRVAPPYKARTLKGAEEIWLLNGEKAVDRAIEAWGITATCLPNGEGHWKEEYLEWFTGARVVYLVLDNDPTGEQHGTLVGGVLMQAGIEARLVRLPGLAEKADCWDFIESGGTLEQAREVAALAPVANASAPPPPPKEKERKAKVFTMPPMNGDGPPADAPDLTGYSRNDVGNAARLVLYGGARLHYARQWEDAWMYYSGAYWRCGAIEEAYAPAAQTLHLLKQQANLKGDDRLWKFADSKQNLGGVAAMINLSRKELAIDVNELDRRPLLINCLNGCFDLETGVLREHRPDDLLTRAFPYPYDPNLGPPMLFLRSLDEWFGASADASEGELDQASEMSDFVRRILGYLMTGSVREKKFFVFHGLGNNGKSTCITTLQDVLGNYAVTISPDSITNGFGRNENNTNADVARTKGARAIFSSEPKEGRKFDQGLLKQLSQGEVEITGVFKGKQPFSFLPTGKVLLETNRMPMFDIEDQAFIDRIVPVWFGIRFEDNEHTGPTRREQLRKEGAQIFNLAVSSAVEYLRDGLLVPGAIRERMKNIRDEQALNDGLEPFLEEFFVRGPQYDCTLADIEALYRPWCERNRLRPWPRNRLSRHLCERTGIRHGNDPKTDHRTPAWLKGLAPKNAAQPSMAGGGKAWYKETADDD